MHASFRSVLRLNNIVINLHSAVDREETTQQAWIDRFHYFWFDAYRVRKVFLSLVCLWLHDKKIFIENCPKKYAELTAKGRQIRVRFAMLRVVVFVLSQGQEPMLSENRTLVLSIGWPSGLASWNIEFQLSVEFIQRINLHVDFAFWVGHMRLKKTEQKDFGASNSAFCRSRSIWKFKNSNPNFLEASSTNNVYFGKCCREARLKWPEIK